LIEHGNLRWRQIERLRNKQPLGFNAFVAQGAPVLLKQYALVRYVLVNDEQPRAVSGEDEAVVQLPTDIDLIGVERQVLRGLELRIGIVGAARAQTAKPIAGAWRADRLCRLDNRFWRR
jgi:hypothetical protein